MGKIGSQNQKTLRIDFLSSGTADGSENCALSGARVQTEDFILSGNFV
jgi:hypothetical protein